MRGNDEDSRKWRFDVDLPWTTLARIDALSNPDIIYPGQELSISESPFLKTNKKKED